MPYSKHKDAEPAATVQKIGRCFAGLGIRFQARYFTPVPGAMSVSLSDPEHGWAVNGKGTDRAYALASACGEAMERFETGWAYREPAEAVDDLPFLDWPDEELRSVEEAVRCPETAPDLRCCCTAGDEAGLIRFVKQYFHRDTVPFVPFYSVRNAKTVLLPERIVRLIDQTNGLSAGNTDAEALAQALAEILERYAKRVIYSDGLTPPEIPEEEIPEELKALKQEIETGTGCTLLLRDASLGKGLPVINVLLIDRRAQLCLTSFGAHPCFSIALERCMTELLQGWSTISDLSLMTPWSQQPPDVNCFRQRVEAFRSDMSDLPWTFLAGDPSWQFRPWGAERESAECTREDRENRDSGNRTGSNEAYVDSMLRVLLRLSDTGDVYIRSCGYLGVPAFQVYVPGVSSVPLGLTEKNLRYGELGEEVNRMLRGGPAPSDAVLAEIADAIVSPDSRVLSRTDCAGLGTLPEALHALILYRLGREHEASELLLNRTAVVDSGMPAARPELELRCMQRYLSLTAQGIPEAQRDALLHRFFDPETAGRVCACLQDRQTAIEAWFRDRHLPSAVNAEANRALHARVRQCKMAHVLPQNAIAELVCTEK